jgi:hypothetical protein
MIVLLLRGVTMWTCFMLRYQVLTVASMKMTALQDTPPCSLLEVCPRFRGAYCIYHQVGNYGGSTYL